MRGQTYVTIACCAAHLQSQSFVPQSLKTCVVVVRHVCTMFSAAHSVVWAATAEARRATGRRNFILADSRTDEDP